MFYIIFIETGGGVTIFSQSPVELSWKPELHVAQSNPSLYVRQSLTSIIQLPLNKWVPAGHNTHFFPSKRRQHCEKTVVAKIRKKIEMWIVFILYKITDSLVY